MPRNAPFVSVADDVRLESPREAAWVFYALCVLSPVQTLLGEAHVDTRGDFHNPTDGHPTEAHATVVEGVTNHVVVNIVFPRQWNDYHWVETRTRCRNVLVYLLHNEDWRRNWPAHRICREFVTSE